MNSQRNTVGSAVSAAVLAAFISTAAHGQATDAHIFVANNGNLEGSVSSMRIAADGSLTFVDKLITGINDQTGTNPQTISLTPDGRFLCTGHGTISNIDEQLTFIGVNSDGTLTQVAALFTPDSPLAVQWLDNEHIAVTKTAGPSQVRVYRFNPDVPSLTTLDTEGTGSFNSDLAYDALHGLLYTQDSSNRTITSWRVNANATLDLIQSVSTGSTFPLGIGLSPDGSRIYGGGGISNGGDKVIGFNIDTNTGMMTLVPGSPDVSPGASPKQVVVTGDGKFAVVAHGTDATIRTFEINALTGELTPTGSSFDVGGQGDLGELAVLGNRVFTTDRYTSSGDPVRGALSFTVELNGTLVQNGTKVDTQGVTPSALVAWPGVEQCLADLTDAGGSGPDGVVDVFDLLELLANWGTSGNGAGIADPANVVDVFDLLDLLAAWGDC